MVAVKGPAEIYSPGLASLNSYSGSAELTSPERKVTVTGAAGVFAAARCVNANKPMPAKPIHNATFVILFIIVSSANDYKNFYFLLNFVSQVPIRITVRHCMSGCFCPTTRLPPILSARSSPSPSTDTPRGQLQR